MTTPTSSVMSRPVMNRSTEDHSRLSAAELYGTPLFYYSLGTLRAQISRLRSVLSRYPVRLLFATMANDRLEILRTISGAGVGACVNSIPHMQRAFAQGFLPNEVQFTSSGLPVSDMAYLQSLDIVANLDSVTQIKTWCGLKQGAVAGARINAASLLQSGTLPDRIGMDVSDFLQAKEVARTLGGRVNGVHVYAGTNFQAANEILPTLRCIFDLAQQHPDIDYVNIGGGIGVDYSRTEQPFDYETFGSEVCAMAQNASQKRGRPIELLFEPGRSLVAESGVFITRVTDIKTLGDVRFVVVDASVSIFPRPFHQPGSYHHVQVLSPDASIRNNGTTPSLVVGRTTFSKDILGRYALPSTLAVGEYLMFEDAGAYCESMISRFLGQREPVYYISEA